MSEKPKAPTTQRNLPCNPEAEKLTLGSVLLDDRNYAKAQALTPDDFILESHRRIWRSAQALSERGERIDRVTVANELMRQNELESVGGLSYLVSLDDAMPQISNLDSYIAIIREKSIKRRIIFMAHKLQNQAMLDEDSSTEMLYGAEKIISGLVASTAATSPLLNPLDVMQAHPQGVTGFLEAMQEPGIPTGFPTLDGIIGGLKEGAYYVLGGVTSSGKSSLAMGIAYNVALQGHGVLVLSPEMVNEQYVMRLVCAEAEVALKAVGKGDLLQDQRLSMMRAAQKISELPIYFDDSANMPIPRVISRISMAKHQHDIRLAIVDYLQILDWRSTEGGLKLQDEYSGLSYASRALMTAARRKYSTGKRISTIAICSLNKQNKNAKDLKPTLGDIRGSGTIAYDADCVAFVHREEIFFPGRPDKRGEAEILVRKHRLGSVGEGKLRFVSKYTRFYDDMEPEFKSGDPE